MPYVRDIYGNIHNNASNKKGIMYTTNPQSGTAPLTTGPHGVPIKGLLKREAREVLSGQTADPWAIQRDLNVDGAGDPLFFLKRGGSKKRKSMKRKGTKRKTTRRRSYKKGSKRRRS